MTTLHILCPQCGESIQHDCRETAARVAAKQLLAWVPAGGTSPDIAAAIRKTGETNGSLEEGEDFESAPFFGSQAWGYPLFGKEGGRAFVALIDQVVRAAGVDPDAIREEIAADRLAIEAEGKATKKRLNEKAARRVEIVRYLKDPKVPLVDRIAKLDSILKERSISLDQTREGYESLYRYLDGYYGGGIDPQINRGRIERLQHELYERQHG